MNKIITNPYFKTEHQKDIDKVIKVKKYSSQLITWRNKCKNNKHDMAFHIDGEGRSFCYCSRCGNMKVRMPIHDKQTNKSPG